MTDHTNDWAHATILDHGFVTLRDSMPHWTWPDSATGLSACDARIVEAARVSYHPPGRIYHPPGPTILDHIEPTPRTKERDEKLIHYLYAHEHMTPFEKVRLEFVAKLPIFVARQWVRHRAGSFNELSARYTELSDEFYIPSLERMRGQHQVNKQGSGEALPEVVARGMQIAIDQHSAASYRLYIGMLGNGLAREVARVVLPTNVYTAWYWTVDLRNLFHFLHLRRDAHAQYEIRVYADAMLEMLRRVAPVATAAYENKEASNADGSA